MAANPQITQKAVAEGVGVSQTWVSQYKTGDQDADIDQLAALASVYGHTLQELVDLRPDPKERDLLDAGRALPLSDVAIEALREFASLDAFGTFQNSQLVRTFKLGAKRAGVTLADDARPYDLRHSFLTEIYRRTGDPFAVSELGMHATLEQTARYAKGAVSARATKAIRSVPRFLTTTKRRNLPIRSSSVHQTKARPTASPRQRQAKKRRKSRGKL